MGITTTRRRLETQGFSLDDAALRQIGPWLRFTPAVCATLIGIATVLATAPMLWALAAVAAAGALFPRHPFDFAYNYGVRYVTRTPVLPVNGAPRRFACGLAALWLAGTATAFGAGHAMVGYVLGGTMTALAVLVSVTDICVPSMIYQSLFTRSTRGLARP